jgi:hypothetical protein
VKQIMVRYKVKPDRAQENERFIANVFGELMRDGPADFRYTSIKLDDGVTFMHIVSDTRPDAPYTISALPAFKAFTANIRDRCDEVPVTVNFDVVGSYRVFDE